MKKDRALEAIRANPQKSNRAIADEIGVSKETVRRARQIFAEPFLPSRKRRAESTESLRRKKRAESTESLRSVFMELSRLSAQQAADELNARTLRTPWGGSKWHVTQVIRMRRRLGRSD